MNKKYQMVIPQEQAEAIGYALMQTIKREEEAPGKMLAADWQQDLLRRLRDAYQNLDTCPEVK